MNPPVLVLSDLTLSAVQAEATRAHLRRGEHSMLAGGRDASDRRYRILGEEFAEIGRELNDAEIDGREPDRDKLVIKLLHAAAMALTWVEALEGQHPDRNPFPPGSGMDRQAAIDNGIIG
jgi:hypothetical protein